MKLQEDAARFLVARDATSKELLGYVHFRFTIHGEIADVMEGERRATTLLNKKKS